MEIVRGEHKDKNFDLASRKIEFLFPTCMAAPKVVNVRMYFLLGVAKECSMVGRIWGLNKEGEGCFGNGWAVGFRRRGRCVGKVRVGVCGELFWQRGDGWCRNRKRRWRVCGRRLGKTNRRGGDGRTIHVEISASEAREEEPP